MQTLKSPIKYPSPLPPFLTPSKLFTSSISIFHHKKTIMAKLTVLATVLVFLLAFTEATTFTTTVTTTTIEEENQRVTERCREQVQRQPMRHCMMYMSQQSPYDDQLSLRMVTNPQEQEHLRQCCMEMRNIDENCRCEAIRVMMRKMQMQGEWQGEQMHEAMQRAKYLPRMCNMRPQQCQW